MKRGKLAALAAISAFSWAALSPAARAAPSATADETGVASAGESPQLALAVEKHPGAEVTRHRKFPWLLAAAGVLAAGLVVLYFYAKHVDWPQYSDDPALFSKFITDPAGDQVLAPEGGPPSLIAYPPADITKISLGVRDDCFYVRVDLAGMIPTSVQKTADEKVEKQSFNLGLDSDNNTATGASGGSDIVFSVSFNYGWRSESPYAWCAFSGSSHDSGTRRIVGEKRAGGPGYNFMVFRYRIANLGTYFPRGGVVKLDCWSEAKSGLYHHFAFDPVQSQIWTIPN